MPRTFVQLPGYDIGPRLGKGAGAVIYSAVERATRRRVAIKHVVRHGPAEDKYIAQAEVEYDVAHRLDHPYLRRCYDLIRVRRWLKTAELFLVMELVEGERLEDRYAEQVPERFEDVTSFFIQIAEGLHALHRYGFAHADMKPNNVILTPGGIKIIDFGQSCPLGSIKERVQGTPDYIAPEQVLRQRIDQRTDIFNFGATMYRVLTGKAYATILPGGPLGARKIQIEGRRANDPPHVLNPHISLPLSRLIEDCCAYKKEDRPADMSQVISRLEMIRHWLARRGDSATAGRRRS